MVYALRAKKNTCEEKLVSKVACCLIPALKQKQKINTDKEKRTREKITKKTNVKLALNQPLSPSVSSHTTSMAALQKLNDLDRRFTIGPPIPVN